MPKGSKPNPKSSNWTFFLTVRSRFNARKQLSGKIDKIHREPYLRPINRWLLEYPGSRRGRSTSGRGQWTWECTQYCSASLDDDDDDMGHASSSTACSWEEQTAYSLGPEHAIHQTRLFSWGLADTVDGAYLLENVNDSDGLGLDMGDMD